MESKIRRQCGELKKVESSQVVCCSLAFINLAAKLSRWLWRHGGRPRLPYCQGHHHLSRCIGQPHHELCQVIVEKFSTTQGTIWIATLQGPTNLSERRFFSLSKTSGQPVLENGTAERIQTFQKSKILLENWHFDPLLTHLSQLGVLPSYRTYNGFHQPHEKFVHFGLRRWRATRERTNSFCGSVSVKRSLLLVQSSQLESGRVVSVSSWGSLQQAAGRKPSHFQTL